MNIKGYLKDVAMIWTKFALLFLPAGLVLCFAFNAYYRHIGKAARYDLFQVATVVVVGLIPAALIMAVLTPRPKQ